MELHRRQRVRGQGVQRQRGAGIQVPEMQRQYSTHWSVGWFLRTSLSIFFFVASLSTVTITITGCSRHGKPSVKSLPGGVYFSGSWNSNWGRIELSQEGRNVFGRYEGFRNGSITGTVEGNVLSYRWTQNENEQHGMGWMVMNNAGDELDGRWGYDDDDHQGGYWHARRLTQ